MKIGKQLLPLINPIQWIKAGIYKRSQPKYNRAKGDLELQFYAKILNNDMLHYGYFDDPTIDPFSISIRDVEDAQIKYAELIAEQITDREGLILDVGCGMGGLSNILRKNNYKIEALTPDINQKRHIAEKYPEISCHHVKFEDFNERNKYETIINSESLQYINLDTAFSKVENLLNQNGKWIITDYFRLNTQGKSKSGHTLVDFLKTINSNNWKVEKEIDITQNCLPTLKLVNAYVDRFVIPAANFGLEKFKIKSPKLFFLTSKLRKSISQKAEKEFAAIDPNRFITEKKYMLFVLSKNQI